MSRRFLGLSLMLVGVLLIVLAIVIAMPESSEADPTAAASTSIPGSGSTSTSAMTGSGEPAAATSQIPGTVSSGPTATTPPTEIVAEFVGSFAAALESGDIDFVMSRLHPDIVSAYSAGACQAWVGEEVMALSDYRVIGDTTGPVDKAVTVAEEQITFQDVYSVPVGFMFGGQEFESSADFTIIDGLVYWLGMCE